MPSTPRCRASGGSSPELGIDLALGAERLVETVRLGLRPGTRELVEIAVFDGRPGVGEPQPLRQQREDRLVEALAPARRLLLERTAQTGAERAEGQLIGCRHRLNLHACMRRCQPTASRLGSSEAGAGGNARP